MKLDFHIDPAVFKAYDIRGVVPDQIDVGAAQQVARAFAHEVGCETAVVGRDVRLTGPEFASAVIEGLVKSGVNVVDIGQVSTDEFYFACGSKSLPGIMVTASHNPKEYNGFKMVKEMPYFVMAKEFMPQVIEKSYEDAQQIGSITQESVTDEFINHMITLVPPSKIKPLKVVIDTSNGAMGPVWKKLGEKLPIEMIELCFEPDGNFPNHGNDIVQPENQEMLRAKVKENDADLGLIFDPDGDRCLLVDDRGVSVPGSWLTGLLGVEELKRNPGSRILYDVRASDAVPDMIKKNGGIPHIYKPGHAYIKVEMVDKNIPFGGENSGHYYFKDFWYCDSGILSALTLLAYVSGLDDKLSRIIQELEGKYFLSDEINSRVENPAKVMLKVKEKYADGELNELSGVAVRYPDWHFVVRPSDNEPLVRLMVEANSRELVDQKTTELLDLIRS